MAAEQPPVKTIAIFGVTGRTGKPVTELALQKGYAVRALVRTHRSSISTTRD